MGKSTQTVHLVADADGNIAQSADIDIPMSIKMKSVSITSTTGVEGRSHTLNASMRQNDVTVALYSGSFVDFVESQNKIGQRIASGTWTADYTADGLDPHEDMTLELTVEYSIF